MELKYIDIGLNLANKQFNKDRDELVKNSYNSGIGIIITGTDLKANAEALTLCEMYSNYNIYCTCGIHPHNADNWDLRYKKSICDMIENDKYDKNIVALGEIGLDFDRMYSKKEKQIRCFDEMLSLAEYYNKPVFLHERSAEDDFLKLLKKHKNICKNAVVHCFTGKKETALRYLNLGCKIGITGWICDTRRNADLVEAIKIIPLDRLMVETDAPYLTPMGHNLDRRNIPNNITYVVDEIAKIKKVDVEEVRKKTLSNTIEFFTLDI